MASKKLKVGVAGARWLGVNCLRFLKKNKNIEIANVCFPSIDEKVWWKDVIDEKELKKMGFKITPWEKWVNLKFDLVFSILHGGIFKKIHLDNSKLGIINLHPAPLPEYRGCNSYAHAIMNGEKTYRVTMHYVDEGIDDGPIIGQNLIKIEDQDTGYSLYQKSQRSALELFKQYSPLVIKEANQGNSFPARLQDETKSNYYKRDSLSVKEASLKWNKKKLYNFVRALEFPPFEPAYVLLNGKKVHLTID